MVIVANGGYRTGSTFVYHVICDILTENKIDYQYGIRDCCAIKKLDLNKTYVVKSHNWLPPEKTDVLTVYTRRNYLDVYASLIKLNKPLPDFLLEIVEEKRREKIMLNVPHLSLEYRDFFDNEIFAVKKISKYINLPCDAARVAQKFKRQVLKKITDNLTSTKNQYEPNHISDDASPGTFINTLLFDEIKKITETYKGV